MNPANSSIQVSSLIRLKREHPTLSYFDILVYGVIYDNQEFTTIYNENAEVNQSSTYQSSLEGRYPSSLEGHYQSSLEGRYQTVYGCILTDNRIGEIFGLENSRVPVNKTIHKLIQLGLVKSEKYRLYRDTKEYRRVLKIED